MEIILKYRGHELTEADVASIRDFVLAHPGTCRSALSRQLCIAHGWVQPNGVPRAMVCHGLLLALHRAGHIELPPVAYVRHNPLAVRRKPEPVSVDMTPVRGKLADLRPLEFRLVRRTKDEPLFNGLVEAHHYLGYSQPVGEHLKYIISSRERPLACAAWCSAPRHLGPRDRFIGWSQEARKRNVRYIAYNTRFLILPWVEVPHLASHILGRMARLLPEDWERIYGHTLHFLETFTDPARYKGTCYRAANWVVLGNTTGRGHNAPTKKRTVPVKAILGYPLSRRFRELLGSLS